MADDVHPCYVLRDALFAHDLQLCVVCALHSLKIPFPVLIPIV
jgi:hypothetical protein